MTESKKLGLTIILPAHNEEQALETCIKKTIQTVETLDAHYEIIIVENGSADDTWQIAQELSRSYKQVKAVHMNTPSFGGAIKKGYSLARGDVVVNLDVDLSTDMTYFKELLNYSKKYDIVTGSRYLDKTIVNRSFTRLLLSQVFNWVLVRGLLRSKIKDNNCGFRAIKKNVGLDLFSSVKNDGDFGMVELIVLAQKKKYTIKEFPVKWKENPKSIKIKFIMRFLVPAIKLWIRLTFSKN